MGQSNSSTANWTMNDWAFGTGENAVQIDEVVEEAGKIPGKLFGAKAIENDESMHKMQRDLLSFDETLKRVFFFWRKKNKKPGQQQESAYEDGHAYEQYGDQNQEYYDESQYPIPEEDEHHLPPIYTNNNEQLAKDMNTSPPWRCRYCTTENKSTDLECRQCKQSGTMF
jgi:hypothetical protein